MCCVEIGNNDNIGLFKKLWVECHYNELHAVDGEA